MVFSDTKSTNLMFVIFQHKNDPLFTEFMEAHVTDKNTWIKEALEKVNKDGDDDDDSGMEEEANDTTDKNMSDEPALPEAKPDQNNVEKVANKQISDLEVSFFTLTL